MAVQIRKELFIVDEEQKHVQFAKTFLVGWDNSLSNQQVGVPRHRWPGFSPNLALGSGRSQETDVAFVAYMSDSNGCCRCVGLSTAEAGEALLW